MRSQGMADNTATRRSCLSQVTQVSSCLGKRQASGEAFETTWSKTSDPPRFTDTCGPGFTWFHLVSRMLQMLNSCKNHNFSGTNSQYPGSWSVHLYKNDEKKSWRFWIEFFFWQEREKKSVQWRELFPRIQFGLVPLLQVLHCLLPLLHTVDDPSAYVELAIDPLFGGAKDTLRYTKKDP